MHRPTKRWFLAVALSLCAAYAVGCSRPSWDRHDSHRYCGPALRGEAWAPALNCPALHLCLHEATLSPAEERSARSELVARGCDAP